MAEDPITISREDLRALIRSEIDDALKRSFSEIGLFAEDADERRAVRLDFIHLRRWREATEGISMKIGNAVLVTVVGAFFVLFGLGLKAWIFK